MKEEENDDVDAMTTTSISAEVSDLVWNGSFGNVFSTDQLILTVSVSKMRRLRQGGFFFYQAWQIK